MSKAIQTRGRHLNHVAWLYDPVIETLSFGREALFRRKTLQYLACEPQQQILDVGCGTGSLTLLIADKLQPPGSVVGIDAAPKMIAMARRKAERLGAAARFEVGVAERLDFADETFDCVVNSMFAHHIDSDLKALAFREMYRVLKPGGRLVTADIDRPTTFWGRLLGWGGRYLLCQVELVDNLRGRLPDFMADAGFSGIRRLEHLHGLISFFSAERP